MTIGGGSRGEMLFCFCGDEVELMLSCSGEVEEVEMALL